MKTTTGGNSDNTKEKRDLTNQQRSGETFRERKPWGMDNQRFSRPQRFQNDWMRFGNRMGERRDWGINQMHNQPNRRNWEATRRQDQPMGIQNNTQSRPIFEGRWDQAQWPPGSIGTATSPHTHKGDTTTINRGPKEVQTQIQGGQLKLKDLVKAALWKNPMELFHKESDSPTISPGGEKSSEDRRALN